MKTIDKNHYSTFSPLRKAFAGFFLRCGGEKSFLCFILTQSRYKERFLGKKVDKIPAFPPMGAGGGKIRFDRLLLRNVPDPKTGRCTCGKNFAAAIWKILRKPHGFTEILRDSYPKMILFFCSSIDSSEKIVYNKTTSLTIVQIKQPTSKVKGLFPFYENSINR